MTKSEINNERLEGEELTGAEIVIQALKDCGVDTVFGYPGGSILPVYDVLFSTKGLDHKLVRHEQGAAHAAEGYARSTGKPGVMIVTSGPGITNTITGLTDAYMDSIPVICISGQVPTFMIGTDAFQEADATGLTRSCTKHNYLVKDIEKLAETIFNAFHIATTGRPGPVLIDVPKDIQLKKTKYYGWKKSVKASYRPVYRGDKEKIEQAVKMISEAYRPVFYVGGGVINSGDEASALLKELVERTDFPITSTLMGLGAFSGEDESFLGMLGMHGTYEANMAMHDSDLIIAVGSRFDDRATGKPDGFSPNSKKIHIDINPASINKNIKVDLGIVGDVASVLEDMLVILREKGHKKDIAKLKPWWDQIGKWRAKNCLAYNQDMSKNAIIKPQYAIEQLYKAVKDKDFYITTEVGQHQMWTAQYFKFKEPKRFMTSGGLGTMGYGLPAAIGVQVAHPKSLVIDVSGDSSVMMNLQEMATAIQYKLPIKIFLINNGWMGMVRQWQELIHGGRYSQSTTSEAMPDFVKLVEAFGGTGFRADTVGDLDNVISKMITTDGLVLADIRVEQEANCFPMVPAGKAHDQVVLASDAETLDREDLIKLF